MALRLEAVTFDVADAPTVAAFWSELLGREMITEANGAFVPGDERQIGLRFVTSESEPTSEPRLHLHLTSSSLDDQERTVAEALRLGGRHLDVGQSDEDRFVVLADPGGNPLCVIEPGNNFLAGTGRLGEVTCSGTRFVGLFWRDALGWPLVWDEGDQTAIQSPMGGTKISWDAWDEPPADATRRQTRQRFDLISVDPDDEAERLVALGATRLARVADGVVLADPDGIEFSLRTG